MATAPEIPCWQLLARSTRIDQKPIPRLQRFAAWSTRIDQKPMCYASATMLELPWEVILMSIGLFRKRIEYTAVALHPGVFQGIVIYFYPKGKIARKIRIS